MDLLLSLETANKTDKDQELKAEIQSIFIEHKGNYAYRRFHLELRNRAYLVNHKRVQLDKSTQFTS
ncbi:unknown domain protein [Streptococcus pneumoniae 2090008]|nr:unknown domain protein [Streptococcus pneumoniae 2090008]